MTSRFGVRLECNAVNVGIPRRFRPQLTQFLHSAGQRLDAYFAMLFGTGCSDPRTQDDHAVRGRTTAEACALGTRPSRCPATSPRTSAVTRHSLPVRRPTPVQIDLPPQRQRLSRKCPATTLLADFHDSQPERRVKDDRTAHARTARDRRSTL